MSEVPITLCVKSLFQSETILVLVVSVIFNKLAVGVMIMDNKCYSVGLNKENNEIDRHLKELIENEMGAMSIETYAYLRINRSGCNFNLISTYPKKWLDIYVKNKYYNFDPVVKKAKSKIMPFSWDQDCNTRSHIFEESKIYDISHGACFIAHGNDNTFSILSICDNGRGGNFINRLSEKEDKIQMILLKFFEEDLAAEKLSYNISLTLREQEILKWLGLGKTYNETSIICGISERTVRFHLMNILKKFNTNSTKYALIKAALYGFIDV
ncbi:helix-turn-helix transcriptional regulator [Lonsdalea quercina]|uniref:helix-turn-helix transcriptional regulator n=1 Tax=Lonsdalea quercina TaxID=71657 RepID=UPI0039762395